MAKPKYNVEDIMRKFYEYHAFKQPILREWRLIRSIYRGEFWNVFKKHMKEYTITPDWNYFEYIVSAYLNSIYSGAFIGTITPQAPEQEEEVQNLNQFLAYNWSKWGMKNKFLHVGEYGELYNLGPVRSDWDSTNRDTIIRAMSPDEVYFDPAVSNYRDGEMLFIERSINVDVLKKNKDYKKPVEDYLLKNKELHDKSLKNKIGYENIETTKGKNLSFIEVFIRNDEGELDQLFILDEAVIIFEKLNISNKFFPVECFQPSRPDGNPYGNSKLLKILNTVIALNLLDSMEATQPYRLLNRVRFVNVDGKLNMRSFADYGATPGASFEVKGDPRTLVYYEDLPVIPDLSNIKHRLENSIFDTTGVDAYYKGRLTNSLQTTGATQAFQARVTMLTDNSRITQLEEFTESLTRNVLENYFVYGGDTDYNIPKLSATGTNKVVATHTINFDKAAKVLTAYDYQITASTLLPMNQANLFESAKALYEMQGQYQFPTPLIQPEDLIRWSDFPQKDLLLQRIEKDKQNKTAENLISDLTNFASIFSKFLGEGMSEEQAAQQAITILIEEKNAMEQNPSIGQGFK